MAPLYLRAHSLTVHGSPAYKQRACQFVTDATIPMTRRINEELSDISTTPGPTSHTDQPSRGEKREQTTSEATTKVLVGGRTSKASSNKRRLQPHNDARIQWLRAGAVAFGLGVAITTGHGVASADSSDSGSESSGTSASPSEGSGPRSAESTAPPQKRNTTESIRPDEDAGAEPGSSASSRRSGSDTSSSRALPQPDDSTVSTRHGDNGRKADDKPVASASDSDIAAGDSDGEQTDASAGAEHSGESTANTPDSSNLSDGTPARLERAVLAPSVDATDTGVRPTDNPTPAAPVGQLAGALSLAVREMDNTPPANPASSAVGTGLFVPLNSLFAFGGRCGLICNGADGTETQVNGVSGGWLVGNGGAGWSSTLAGVAGGNGGNGGLLWATAASVAPAALALPAAGVATPVCWPDGVEMVAQAAPE